LNVNKIVMSLGMGYFLLAMLRSDLDLGSEYILGLSISAFLFVFNEFVTFGKSNIQMLEHKKLKFFSDALLFFAVMSIIVLPHFPIWKKIDPITLSEWNDSFTLVAFGFTLILISYKSSEEQTLIFQQATEQLNQNRDSLLESAARIDLLLEKNELLKMENEELKQKIAILETKKERA